ncbi:cobyrinate a,c-diamide synthase [Allostreptomyces psammosilenae]|uniref:Hydrogenobyrinate a,c-diamide synthase n=1 Tax=Allostreptomyces psammosilenae TaxID=1892865 RepID=A0A852ZZX9_9ACTN|nr:cobyrinate a,c-diamide synthase [Allostreptomyces psammosilenae]NYI04131.1 cobyrinic acid a,c-diamide synthase [Allostreptomyces psammosilenae]
MSTAPPRLVVAAPSSGSGKTTVATGLMAAFAARGLAVSGHKVGPDYIDPGYHALATGRPGRNLDARLCGTDRLAPLFLHAAGTPRPADIAVVEGVMGLFDGAAGQGELASTAQVAKVLRAPVVLVVDARGQGRSVAALVQGFAGFDTGVRLGGVILNQVGGARHEEILRDALEETGLPVLGVLGRHAAVSAPSRHLGLVPAVERRAEAVRAVAELADLVAASCDLAALHALARSAPDLPAEPWDPAAEATAVSPAGIGDAEDPADRAATPGAPGPVGPVGPVGPGEPAGGAGARPRIAMAGGAAFSFGYEEHRELLAAAGAEVADVDPLRDEALPEGTDALVVGGGFPEVYAAELAENTALRHAVAAAVASGVPVVAECAGLLYLSRELDGRPMCGVVDATARMTDRLTLGYREAVAATDSVLAAAGTRIAGHEFHRTVVEPGAGAAGPGGAGPAWLWRGPSGRPHAEGFVTGHVHASYLHLHWAGAPQLPVRLAALARRLRSAR